MSDRYGLQSRFPANQHFVSAVEVSMNGIELRDRAFIAAIAQGRKPNSSVGKVLDCYRVPGELERQLKAAR